MDHYVKKYAYEIMLSIKKNLQISHTPNNHLTINNNILKDPQNWGRAILR